jgi:hypothetical protein
MKKLALLVFTLLFAIGTYFSTASITVAEAAYERGEGPCAHRCHENYEDAVRRCRELPPALRERCVREAREHLRACLRNCRD